MSAITIDGDLVHYEKLGRGRPVILVHGWLGSWRYWIPTMQQLHLKYSVYTLDFPGFGDSARNLNKYTTEKQVMLLRHFMEQLGIPKAAMIGHGLGALVLTQFARQYPEKVARLLLVSLPIFDPGNLKERIPPAVVPPAPPTIVSRAALAVPEGFSAADNSDVTIPSINTRHAFARATMDAVVSAAASAEVPGELSAPDSGDMTITSNTIRQALLRSAMDAILTAPAPTDASNALTASDNSDATIASATIRQTLIRPSLDAVISAPSPAEVLLPEVRAVMTPQSGNALLEAFGGKTPLFLLERCFKKSDPIYEKLRTDIEKTDVKVLNASAYGFNAGNFLDTLRSLSVPTVAVHGSDDPLIPAPSDDVWLYLTLEREELFVPIPLPAVRHFPMLEYDPFMRLAGDFLETPDISKLETRERWRRRSR